MACDLFYFFPASADAAVDAAGAAAEAALQYLQGAKIRTRDRRQVCYQWATVHLPLA